MLFTLPYPCRATVAAPQSVSKLPRFTALSPAGRRGIKPAGGVPPMANAIRNPDYNHAV